ncbi:hypothetical protein MKZ38_002318 [Zalerion maritima]|uniref:Cytochrome P450 n=1 Tax=Zalerion maritima TaxID=339359 RepID=A0AAD5WQW1_9PEZI|nr:hypothetical protein MKZ38_002318 [Zalerion maritima]
MALLAALVPSSQSWRVSLPATFLLLVLSLLLSYVCHLSRRPAFPPNSPPLLKPLPVVGSPAFFTARNDLFRRGRSVSPRTGNFSFYVGRLRIVGLSGRASRRAYFDSKALDLARGYERLFADGPSLEGGGSPEFGSLFNRNVKTLLLRENFVRNLGVLSRDVREGLGKFVAAAVVDGKKEEEEEEEEEEEKKRKQKKKAAGVLNPYEDVYRLVYQLTMRTLGCEEIAEDRKLGDETLRLYEDAEEGTSPARFVVPWLPTPAWWRRVKSGARLYGILDGIVKERRRSKEGGARKEDALQVLLDQGASTLGVIEFIMGSLFSGQLNTSINAAALLVYLAQNREWMDKIRSEVDGVVDRHRAQREGEGESGGESDESALDVLKRLPLEAWENDFPLVDVALKETIRIELVGSSYRMNDSGRDMEIGHTGEVVPNGAFSVYQMDDAHMDPDVYPEPLRWDPGRFLRGEDKKQPDAFLGWGAGRHPCRNNFLSATIVGMRFAKLETFLITAHFISMFDFQLSDKNGNLNPDPPVLKDRTRFTAHKPSVPVYFRPTAAWMPAIPELGGESAKAAAAAARAARSDGGRKKRCRRDALGKTKAAKYTSITKY